MIIIPCKTKNFRYLVMQTAHLVMAIGPLTNHTPRPQLAVHADIDLSYVMGYLARTVLPQMQHRNVAFVAEIHKRQRHVF